MIRLFNKKPLMAVFCVFVLLLPPVVCLANSAEPPSLALIITNPPDDLIITVHTGGQSIEARKHTVAWESYYAVYGSMMRMLINPDAETILSISGEGVDFDIKIDQALVTSYNNIYTLDLSKQDIIPGKLFIRSCLLVCLRVVLTLLIEGLIFLLFGFRKKESWIAFLLINLATQGLLNIWLNGFSPFESYVIISLVLAEILILIAELIAFPVFVKEHKGIRRVAYVLLSNTASLILGGYLITMLPI